MKRRIFYRTFAISRFLFFCVLLIGFACNSGLRKTKVENNQSPGSSHDNPSFEQILPPTELIIWRKPDSSDKQVEDWIKKVENRGKLKTKVVRKLCGSCDNALMLLTGPGIETFIQTHPADGKVVSGTTSPPSGEEGPVYYARNYRVARKKPAVSPISSIEIAPPVIRSGESVKIAVFDTGVDPREASQYAFNSRGRSCITGAKFGWNFIRNNGNFQDDEETKHGTVVTRFITDQVAKSGKNRVEILPVKTHDANGVSNLFSILCGFAYAYEMGAQIINASFGFYVPRPKLSPEDDPADPNVLLLRKYVQHYLTQNKILLVTAAGNTDDVNLKKTFEEHGWPYKFENPRDLNQVSFFPASLARSPDFPNVIAVTTVYIENGKSTVSPDQNFSKNVVDIGVTADKILEGRYVFRNLLLKNGNTVEGSSFAAPIVSGILGANYDKIKPVILGNNFKKEDIWKTLGSEIITKDNALSEIIKDGVVMTRLK